MSEKVLNKFHFYATTLLTYSGEYPTSEQGLSALFVKPVSLSNDNWDGPYLSKAIPKDPWGNDYQYYVPGENGLPYGIMSLGKDGVEGGEGKDADITSW